jgi:hypothetical protein
MNEIAAVSRVPDQLDVFWVGGDGRVYSSWWHQDMPWSGAFSIGGFFPAGAPVAAVARMQNHLDLFVVGNDGRVYTSWWHEGQPWSGANDNWMSIGGFFPPGCSVTALSRTPDHLDVFVIGNDGRVYTSWWHDGVGWSGINDNWMSLGGFFPSTAVVTALSRVSNHLDVFITGNDGRVYTSWWHDGVGWSGINDNWMSLGGFFPPGNKVSAVSRMPDHLDLFITGNDGRVYTSWWVEGAGWSGINDNWAGIGGFFPVKAPITSVARLSNHLDLFITGNDGRVYTSWWHEGQPWSGAADNWMSIGGFFPPGGPIAGHARVSNHLDLFIIGNDGQAWTSWWHEGQPWSGAADNWLNINSAPGSAQLRNLRLQLQNLRVEQAQEDGVLSDGDEPYLVTLGFRSKFRTPGSTSVFWSSDLHELGNLDSGDNAGIPASMGTADFPGVQIVSVADLAQQRFPEMFGAFVLCMESDATPFGAVRDLMEKLRGALHNELVRLVEGGQLISNFAAPRDQLEAEAKAQLGQTVRNVMDTLKPSLLDAIGLWLQSLSDPDDFIGYQVIMFAGVDDTLGALLPSMSRPGVSVGPFKPGPLDLPFEGDDARYRVTGAVTG